MTARIVIAMDKQIENMASLLLNARKSCGLSRVSLDKRNQTISVKENQAINFFKK